MSAALQEIEARNLCPKEKCNFIYVVPSSIDPRALESLASIRKVVAPSDVPESAKLYVKFPKYVEIDKLQISRDTALVEGNWYPYGHNSLNCGEGFSFPFKFENGAWVPLQWQLRMC
jgi:hypothetical protein